MASLPTPPESGRARVDERDVLVAGEAEVDEPLAVEALAISSRISMRRGVVLDQVVVGRQDVGDLALGGEGRKWNLNAGNSVQGMLVQLSSRWLLLSYVSATSAH